MQRIPPWLAAIAQLVLQTSAQAKISSFVIRHFASAVLGQLFWNPPS
jgi:hypothetical protein